MTPTQHSTLRALQQDGWTVYQLTLTLDPAARQQIAGTVPRCGSRYAALLLRRDSADPGTSDLKLLPGAALARLWEKIASGHKDNEQPSSNLTVVIATPTARQQFTVERTYLGDDSRVRQAWRVILDKRRRRNASSDLCAGVEPPAGEGRDD